MRICSRCDGSGMIWVPIPAKMADRGEVPKGTVAVRQYYSEALVSCPPCKGTGYVGEEDPDDGSE